MPRGFQELAVPILQAQSLNSTGHVLRVPGAWGSHTSSPIPKQYWIGPEGSRSLRFPYFKTIGTLRW